MGPLCTCQGRRKTTVTKSRRSGQEGKVGGVGIARPASPCHAKYFVKACPPLLSFQKASIDKGLFDARAFKSGQAARRMRPEWRRVQRTTKERLVVGKPHSCLATHTHTELACGGSIGWYVPCFTVFFWSSPRVALGSVIDFGVNQKQSSASCTYVSKCRNVQSYLPLFCTRTGSSFAQTRHTSDGSKDGKERHLAILEEQSESKKQESRERKRHRKIKVLHFQFRPYDDTG